MARHPLRRLFDRAYPDPDPAAGSCRNTPEEEPEVEEPEADDWFVPDQPQEFLPVGQGQQAPLSRITDHQFQDYELGTLTICRHLYDNRRPCGRFEHEHATVPERP